MVQSQATVSDLSLSLEIEASLTELMLQTPTEKKENKKEKNKKKNKKEKNKKKNKKKKNKKKNKKNKKKKKMKKKKIYLIF
ncbi:uncharacterized [Tachysurus ichikawai]